MSVFNLPLKNSTQHDPRPHEHTLRRIQPGQLLRKTTTTTISRKQIGTRIRNNRPLML